MQIKDFPFSPQEPVSAITCFANYMQFQCNIDLPWDIRVANVPEGIVSVRFRVYKALRYQSLVNDVKPAWKK